MDMPEIDMSTRDARHPLISREDRSREADDRVNCCCCSRSVPPAFHPDRWCRCLDYLYSKPLGNHEINRPLTRLVDRRFLGVATGEFQGQALNDFKPQSAASLQVSCFFLLAILFR